ncbi:hypothetical protein CLU79DRAFT_739495 [Phycomyces nitens]|nr:hypothetical protein CLU79DRAFT_739495 [Phycomyces nitens]
MNSFPKIHQEDHSLTSHDYQSIAEFTQSEDWPQHIVQELRDMVHVLSPKLCIVACSQASIELLGYQPSELVGCLITEFIHVDEVDMFSRQCYKTMNTTDSIRICYRMLRKNGKYVLMETKGHFKQQYFFGSARCLPTRASRIMDTFLDLKMENEILKRKIAFLRMINGENNTISEPDRESGQVSSSDDEDSEKSVAKKNNILAVQSCPTFVKSVQTLAGSFDIPENVVPFDDGCQQEICLDNGQMEIGNKVLHASNFIATDQEDLGIGNWPQLQTSAKRKFTDISDKKICLDCSTTNSPEWRKGPRGPKTLCNACGLRWAKANKKSL